MARGMDAVGALRLRTGFCVILKCEMSTDIVR